MPIVGKKEREKKARRALVAFASSVRLSGFDGERELSGAFSSNSSFGGGNVASSVSSLPKLQETVVRKNKTLKELLVPLRGRTMKEY